MRVHYLILPILVAWASVGMSQTMMTNTPNASPKATVSQMIGLTKVYISYHRPAVKERAVWGKLVPYNATWRAGANENTVIYFSDDVWIEGEKLAAGKYGFHIIPREGEATLVFSTNHSSWGSYSYNEAEDALRVEIKTKSTDYHTEYLTYGFTNFEKSAATCYLKWEKMKFPFTIKTDVHEAVLAGFRDDLRTKPGWTWAGWNEAANYCLQNDINHKEALGWASRSVFMDPNPNNMLVKAKLTAQSKEDLSDEETQKVILKTLGKDLEAHSVTWKEYHGAANYAMKAKAWDKAMEWIETSVGMSRNMTNLMTKTQILEEKGETKEAKKVKTEALEKGTNAELNMFGYQLMWSGKTAEAVEIFKANAEKNPEDPNVWDSLGEGYMNNNQKEEAIKALKKSLSLNPPANVKANSLNLLQQMGVKHHDKKIQP